MNLWAVVNTLSDFLKYGVGGAWWGGFGECEREMRVGVAYGRVVMCVEAVL